MVSCVHKRERGQSHSVYVLLVRPDRGSFVKVRDIHILSSVLGRAWWPLEVEVRHLMGGQVIIIIEVGWETG